MSETLVIALLSFAGTILGSLIGILTANKLTQYRIEQLEKTVNSFRNDLSRISDLETHNEVQDEKIRQLQRQMEALK